MDATIRDIGTLVRAARADRGLSQEDLAAAVSPPTNRTAVALLEQGRRLPPESALRSICSYLHVPTSLWEPLLDKDVVLRLEFEDALSELVGHEVSLRHHDRPAVHVAQRSVLALLGTGKTKEQLYDSFCAVLVHYGLRQPRRPFFDHYLSPDSFRTLATFREAIQVYQRDAIRLFASFGEAYSVLAQSADVENLLAPLAKRSVDKHRERTEWTLIEEIPEPRLADLGYISAARAKKEQSERAFLAEFLEELAQGLDSDGRTAIAAYSEKRRRKVGSLLRSFDSILQHDLLSPLFGADPDELRREARRLAPKEAGDLQRMEETQAVGQRNLSHYLAADHIDVYVATSMRSDADFVSVNVFVKALFGHSAVSALKLRYFNPTQSWIEDRVAKGLVEALMLKRADYAVYMAQKEDTFGKDSEASVALGQGKPVIVYVPRLHAPDANVDSEALGRAERSELQRIVETEAEGDDAEVDPTTDHQALLAQVLQIRLAKARLEVLAGIVKTHWADFDLYGEAARIEAPEQRGPYRSWLDSVVKSEVVSAPSASVRDNLIGILVATATNFEKRATVFRAVHPLALQVILSTGVLNGILVARSVESCAELLVRLVHNDLDLRLHVDEDNYRLVEATTNSTVRVISRHQLLKNAFSTFYRRP